MSQLTPDQQRALSEADRHGGALVTMIDGRVAIILPPTSSDEDTANLLARISAALAREEAPSVSDVLSERITFTTNDGTLAVPVHLILSALASVGYVLVPPGEHDALSRLRRARQRIDRLDAITLRGVINNWVGGEEIVLLNPSDLVRQLLAVLDVVAIVHGDEVLHADCDESFRQLRDSQEQSP